MIDLWLLLKAAILGLVEGATEFIPVSSTGHLILARNWLGWNDQRAETLEIFIQLPAILAVVWMYRGKVLEVLRTLGTREASRRLVLNLVIGTVPAVVIGLPTRDWVKRTTATPFWVAVALVVGGIAILLIERWKGGRDADPPAGDETLVLGAGGRAAGARVQSVDDIPVRLALGVGVIQVLAILFPGISRSGATIMGGLSLGLSRVAATEFSFFLAIPAMFGATAVELFRARDVLTAADIPIFAVGGLVSFLSALLVIRALLAFVARNSFRGFAWYRIVVGVVLVAAAYWIGSGVTQ